MNLVFFILLLAPKATVLSSGCWSLRITGPEEREAGVIGRAKERFEHPSQAQLEQARMPAVDFDVWTRHRDCADRVPQKLVLEAPEPTVISLAATRGVYQNGFGATSVFYDGSGSLPANPFKVLFGSAKNVPLWLILDEGRVKFTSAWVELDVYPGWSWMSTNSSVLRRIDTARRARTRPSG
jgi:hypothetical protein